MMRAIAMTGKDVVIITCLCKGDDTSQRHDTNRRDCISRGGTNRDYDTSNRDDPNKRENTSMRELK